MLPAAAAQPVPAAASVDELIIAPLLEELSSAPLPSLRLASLEGHEGWRVTAPSIDTDAAYLASSALSSASPSDIRFALGAFSAPQTVIGRTPSGGYVTLAVSDNDYLNPVTAALTPDGIDVPAWMFSADRERSRAVALRYEGRFDSFGGADGLDVGLMPRAGLSMGDRGSATEFGATVRVGHYLHEEADGRGGWWLFAGADRQAVIYEPGTRFDIRTALTLQPYAMVGDAQAGVAMRMYGADLSLAYVRRETNWSMPTQSWEEVEDFAAFSLTIRR
ncbi:MAG: lipid A-modifier LpxR family protein [Glycocaulis sp.]